KTITALTNATSRRSVPLSVVVHRLGGGLGGALTGDVMGRLVEQLGPAERVADPSAQLPAGVRVALQQAGAGVGDVQLLGLLGAQTDRERGEDSDGGAVTEHGDEV